MRTHVRLVAGLSLLLSVVSCTSTTSEPTDRSGLSSAPTVTGVTGGTPTASVMANPQPETCPRHWEYARVPGSDTTMVPGQPLVVVSCSVGRRSVIHGSQLTKLVDLFNGVPALPSDKCFHNLGGMVLISTQLYFNYASGEMLVLNVDAGCRTVSNGGMTAKFSQALSGTLYGQG